jgi:hypothetical protein
MLLLNAFSLNMLTSDATIRVTTVPVEKVRELPLTSAVGHADTAAVFADTLGVEVPCNRQTVTLAAGQSAIVGQYRGPRLAEGATQLPPGATIQWMLIEVMD